MLLDDWPEPTSQLFQNKRDNNYQVQHDFAKQHVLQGQNGSGIVQWRVSLQGFIKVWESSLVILFLCVQDSRLHVQSCLKQRRAVDRIGRSTCRCKRSLSFFFRFQRSSSELVHRGTPWVQTSGTDHLRIGVVTLDFGRLRNAWQTRLSNNWTSTNTILSSNFFNSLSKVATKANESLYILLSRYRAIKRVSNACFKKMRFSWIVHWIVCLHTSIWSGSVLGISEK